MTPAEPCKFRTPISSFSPHGDSVEAIFQRELFIRCFLSISSQRRPPFFTSFSASAISFSGKVSTFP
jgi:hypothetical protein